MIPKLILLSLLIFSTLSYQPIQAHSFNDLDYLSNIIHKGIDYYKVDISMANRQSCQQHSTWKQTQKCLNTSQYIDQICCLAMRGDASSTPYFNYDFNTTDEFIQLLDNELSLIVEQQPKRKLLFAINFQYGHDFEDFISEKFLLDLANIQLKYKSNVLLGTGSDSFILEYDRICFNPANVQCTDERKKIANTEIFLQTSSYSPYDSRDHKKRYRNFNVMYEEIEKFCREGFPSWINKYPQFPLIFWEPSNEMQIQYVMDQYLKPTCMKKHNRTIEGMAMATNIDTQMFDIYMKKLVNNSTVWDIDNEKSYFEGKNIKMLKTMIKGVQSLVTVYKLNKETVISVYGMVEGKMKLNIMKKLLVIGADQKILNVIDNGNNIIIVTQFSDDTSSILYFNYDINILTTKQVDKAYASTAKGSSFFYLKYDMKSKKHYIMGTIDFTYYKQYAQIQSQYTFTSMIIQNVQQFVLVGHSNGRTYMVSVKQQQIIHDKQLTYGQYPTIIKLTNGNIAILLQNSMCHCGLLMNNNDMNKCTFYRENQYMSLTNVHGIVTVLQAPYDQLLQSSQIITACSKNKNIHFTKLMNTYSAHIAQFNNQIMIGGGYLPVQKQDLVSALFCGGSNYNNKLLNEYNSALVIASFNNNHNNSRDSQHHDHNLIVEE